MDKTIKCFHCGDPCITDRIQYLEKDFCCIGCKTVFEILSDSSMGTYYTLEDNPGYKISRVRQKDQYAFLDQAEFKEKFLLFNDEQISKISLSVPQIHCSSCIWLLENLNRLSDGIIYCTVNFPKRKADITFNNTKLSLREVAELLSTIGYDPDLTASKTTESDAVQNSSKSDKSLIYKIGIAGFCFGNIMLFAFPEYFGLDDQFADFRKFFGYLSMGLAIPVFFYSGQDYLINALKGLRQKFINIDVPIALGMVTLFARSAYEIISGTGSGYFDSLSGLVFFLLLGKWFQRKTYDALSFDRDYKSYFPIAVNKIVNGEIVPTQIEMLERGDLVELRNHELIPSDGILMNGEAYIDYSFITGESDLSHKKSGDKLYAGGRQVGSKIVIELIKVVDNSYLTELWNQDVFTHAEKSIDLNSIVNKISKYFTAIILFITLAAGLFWFFQDASKTWLVVCSVLIVACPCALALSVPFTLGNMTRILGHLGLYLKNAEVIEKMSEVSHIVLDKTGTITNSDATHLVFNGLELSEKERSAIASCASNSAHPLSMAVVDFVHATEHLKTDNFLETVGKGVEGSVGEIDVILGSKDFLNLDSKIISNGQTSGSKVYVSLSGEYKGFFFLQQNYRKGLKKVIYKLKKNYNIHLLSGDNNSQGEVLRSKYDIDQLYFDQSPLDKLNHIKNLQDNQANVLMIGDGLNDAGALKQSNVGIAVSDKVHQFSPACDAILSAKMFDKLDAFIQISKKSLTIIYISFIISFLYNIIGLYFAVTGQLSPVFAAILMPVSSISVVAFTTLATNFLAKKMFKN